MNKYQELQEKLSKYLDTEKARRDKLENVIKLFCKNFTVKFKEYLGENVSSSFTFNNFASNSIIYPKFKNETATINFQSFIKINCNNEIYINFPVTFYFFKNHIATTEKYLSINIEKSKDQFTFFDCVDPNLEEDNLNVISTNNLMERWYNAILFHVINNEKFIDEYK